MPSFALLDLVVGMVFIFLLLSLVCLAINEMIATVVNMRARTLKTGVRSLLLGPKRKWIDTKLADYLFEHPLIESLRERRTIPYGNPKPPSYIPARTFTLALIDLMREGNLALPATTDVAALRAALTGSKLLREDLKLQLAIVIDEAHDDIELAKKAIDRWFLDGMERLSAVYKQRIQLIGLIVALGVTCTLDASTIRMARALATDSALRGAFAEQAVAFSKNAPAPVSGAITQPANNDSLKARFARADTILDLSRELLGKATSSGLPIGMPERVFRAPNVAMAIAQQLWSDATGLLITVFAISLGAPFWFDMLNKVVNLRGAGRAPEEKPKSPEAVPPARA